jgi:diadenosine tetraphosphate (Ap4A) HIT family hydrolase
MSLLMKPTEKYARCKRRSVALASLAYRRYGQAGDAFPRPIDSAAQVWRSSMNETIHRFGYPQTLIAEHEHWVVLLRPAQPTLGSLVLAAKSDALAFADLPPAAFAELGAVVASIEAGLRGAVRYSKINYLMLMMVDPNVHLHVIPRYEGERTAEGLSIADSGWPKMPVLGDAVELDDGQIAMLVEWLRPALEHDRL